ncbi:MAG: radical SAM protein [Gaiellaceae bacterium]
MRVIEMEVRSALVQSGLGGVDYVVNPYTGCRFGCSYCYATFMSRYVSEPTSAWGEYVYVKRNIVELFERELARMKPERRNRSIFISSVTDPYQGVEAKYRLTRGVMTALARERYPGPVAVLTKSPMLLRDIDLFRELPDFEAGLTVTSGEDEISRWLEVHAPPPRKRLEALRALNEAGIRTYAFVGPLVPHFVERPELLEDLFARLADAGVRRVYVEHLNAKGYIRKRLDEVVARQSELVRGAYAEACTREHRARLEEIVSELIERYGMELRLGAVIDHPENETRSRR